MATKKTETIYRRPKSGYEELDPENWEDLAICDAYDNAVDSKFQKSGDSKQNGILESNKTSHKKNFASLKNCKEAGDNYEQKVPPIWTRSTLPTSKGSKNSNMDFNLLSNGRTKRANDKVWTAGDTCVALYYEDGLYYDCKIISIDKTGGTCSVEYSGYGNKETIDIADLHSPEEWKETQSSGCKYSDKATDCSSQNTSSLSSGQSSLSSTEDTSSDVTQDIYKGRCSKKKKNEDRKEHKKAGSHNRLNSDPLFVVPPPPPPFFMGQTFGFPAPHPSLPFNSGLRKNAPDLSDDALSSLLMSWYMAGYHTGYYQGINSSNPKKNKRK